MIYYPEYQPKNPQHFQDMLHQFTSNPEARGLFVALWTLDPAVDRQDIVVALGRAERDG